VVPVEAMVSVEALVSVAALMGGGPTWVAATEPVAAPTMSANGRLAGPIDSKHDRQCSECHERQFRMCELLHGDASLSTSTHLDGDPSRTIHPAGQHHRHRRWRNVYVVHGRRLERDRSTGGDTVATVFQNDTRCEGLTARRESSIGGVVPHQGRVDACPGCLYSLRASLTVADGRGMR
jgi:hypothetical protein